MMEWWSSLALGLQIFYSIGILATTLLVIQLVMTLMGLGGEGAMDGMDGGGGLDVGGGLGAGAGEGMGAGDGFDGDHGDGLGLISFRTVVAFLAGFGWTGVIVRGGGLGMPVSVLAAAVVGFLLMLLVFWLMKSLYSLRQSGSLDYRNAVGEVGTVYVSIPPAGTGSGQIQVVVQGRLATVAATTAAGEKIPSGVQVKVVKLMAGNTLQVEPV